MQLTLLCLMSGLPGCLLETSECGRGLQSAGQRGCLPVQNEQGPPDAEVDQLVIETSRSG